MSLFKTVIILSMVFVVSCNKNLTKEESKELWSKAQTSGEILNRSGTPINSANNKKAALRDAETRLSTGGGLFGKEGLAIFGGDGNKGAANQGGIASIGMPINPYLWKASLETINFMPLSSADPFAGLIITDWYSQNNTNERCKINIFIRGVELKTSNLKVNSFCQTLSDTNNWVSNETDIKVNAQIENAILNKAKKLKLSTN